MTIVDDAKKEINDVFGEFSAKKVEHFAEMVDPKKKPKDFLDMCKTFVAGMLGETFASEKFKRLYTKYT